VCLLCVCVYICIKVKGQERMLMKALPEHRIEYVKYRERLVWDKHLRLDLVFGKYMYIYIYIYVYIYIYIYIYSYIYIYIYIYIVRV
jgi:hypothetical protein